jgi:hypothetical protein
MDFLKPAQKSSLPLVHNALNLLILHHHNFLHILGFLKCFIFFLFQSLFVSETGKSAQPIL